MEIGECNTVALFIRLDEWHKYARDHQRAKQKNHVRDSIVLHNDMHDGKQPLSFWTDSHAYTKIYEANFFSASHQATASIHIPLIINSLSLSLFAYLYLSLIYWPLAHWITTK